MRICSIPDCGVKHYAKGLCEKHYQRQKLTGHTGEGVKPRLPLSVRFWRKVDIRSDDECWEWKGCMSNKTGYGAITKNGKNVGAHRVSYELNKGPIQEGLYILHSCDNRKCVNPNHLRAGTCQENIQEAFDKGRKSNPIAYGEQNPKSKLNLTQVEFIKSHPEMQHTELAKLFNVSPNCIRGVRIGRTWSN